MRIDTNKELFILYISNNLNLKKIIEHGNPWNCKLSTLKELAVLPKEILIPYEAPDEDQENQTIAWKMVRNKLSNYAEPVPVSDTKLISNFARG